MYCVSLQKALGEGVMQAGAQLVELDLSDNAFGPNGLVGVVELLKSPACFGLKTIKFNNNGLGVGGGQVSCGWHLKGAVTCLLLVCAEAKL